MEEREAVKRTWKKQVEEESEKFGLRTEGALCRSKWSVGVKLIFIALSQIWPPSHVGATTRYEAMVLSLCNRIIYPHSHHTLRSTIVPLRVVPQVV